MGSEHSHNHGHGKGAHSHGHSHAHAVTAKNESRMALAAVLTGLFMVVEVVGGYISGSLALLADAGHMLTDFVALSMAWVAFRMAHRPANWRHTFGLDRVSILVAFVNGLSLFFIAALIVAEAIKRMGQPNDVLGGTMLIIAVMGLAINIVVFLILLSGDKENLNMRGAILHVMGDMLGSVAAIVAALIIYFTGWVQADLIMSVLVAVILLRSAWYVVRESAHILLEGAPEGLDRRAIALDIQEQFSHINSVEHIHIWSISQERPMMTLQARIKPSGDVEAIAKAIKLRLKEEFGIDHSTLEITRDTR